LLNKIVSAYSKPNGFEYGKDERKQKIIYSVFSDTEKDRVYIFNLKKR